MKKYLDIYGRKYKIKQTYENEYELKENGTGYSISAILKLDSFKELNEEEKVNMILKEFEYENLEEVRENADMYYQIGNFLIEVTDQGTVGKDTIEQIKTAIEEAEFEDIEIQ